MRNGDFCERDSLGFFHVKLFDIREEESSNLLAQAIL